MLKGTTYQHEDSNEFVTNHHGSVRNLWDLNVSGSIVGRVPRPDFIRDYVLLEMRQICIFRVVDPVTNVIHNRRFFIYGLT